MGDDKGGAVFHQQLKRFLYGALGGGIEGRGSLVEQQDGGVFQNGAGDGDTLPLAAGELDAIGADDGVIALRQLGDEFMCVGLFGSGDDFLFRRMQAAIGDVGAHGVVEQHHVLADEREGIAQRMDGDLADVLPIDADGAGADIIEAQQQVHDGGFAGARGANECHSFAGGHAEIQVAYAAMAVAIGEGDLINLNLALTDGEGRGIGPVMDGGSDVHHLEETAGGGHALMQLRVHASKGFHRAVGHHHGGDEGGEFAGGGGVIMDGAIAAIPQHHGHGSDADERHDGGGERLHARRAVIELEQLADGEAGALGLVIFAAVGLHHAHAEEDAVELGGKIGQLGLGGIGNLAHAAAEAGDRHDGEDQDEDGQQRHLPVVIDQHAAEEKHGAGFLDEAGEHLADRLAHEHDVVGEA